MIFFIWNSVELGTQIWVAGGGWVGRAGDQQEQEQEHEQEQEQEEEEEQQQQKQQQASVALRPPTNTRRDNISRSGTPPHANNNVNWRLIGPLKGPIN